MRKWWIAAFAAILAVCMVVGVSMAFAGNGSKTAAAQGQQTKEVEQAQDAQKPSYLSSIRVNEPEPQNLDSMAKITADQAEETALAASPGSTVTGIDLDNENGNLVWGVELSNGTDVKVDAGNGRVLHVEQPDANEPGEKEGEGQVEETEDGAGGIETQESPANN